jgi:hypothetical protein
MTARFRLPPQRKRERSGIERVPQRVFPRHRRWVRSHACCVPGCTMSPVDFAHVKTRGSGGDDRYGVSLCRMHHSEQHRLGVASFGKRYGIDLWELAREFARRSPDRAIAHTP